MRKLTFIFYVVAFFCGTGISLAQIDSGSPAVEFGSVTSYDYGIMPTNLPAGDRAMHAKEAYNNWIRDYYVECGTTMARIKFDTPDQTVSEGIAYGMMLTVYAGDKNRFDRLWNFYKDKSNSRGIMHWMVEGCNHAGRDNGATDAELDAAHALIIASEQWPLQKDFYLGESRTLLAAIKQHEMGADGKTLNGDTWGNSAYTCANPSYMSPGYYRQYALVDAPNSGFWSGAAVTEAEKLLNANANARTGLVSNWSDWSGAANTCGPNNPDIRYGSDACRTPWRMATDVVWHGASTAATAYDLSKRMADFIGTNTNSLRGPLAQNAQSITSGDHQNGSYTTFALTFMALDASYQQRLNEAYTAVVGLSSDGRYFNETIRALSLFMLTGNFWKPGTSGVVQDPVIIGATTNDDGSQIELTFSKAMSAPAAGNSGFSISLNGTVASNAVTGATGSGTKYTLSVTPGTIKLGQLVTVNYSGTSVKSTDNGVLKAITGYAVLNTMAGNETHVDDCEDGNANNFMGGAWFVYTDHAVDGASTTVPAFGSTFVMANEGANGSTKSAKVTYTLNKGQWLYGPFAGVGVNFAPEGLYVDATTSTGITFYYKSTGSAAISVRPQINRMYNGTMYAANRHFSYSLPAAANWTKISILWSEFTQPSWFNASHIDAAGDPSKDIPADADWANFDLKMLRAINFHVEGPETSITTGTLAIDDLIFDGYPPVVGTMAIGPARLELEIPEVGVTPVHKTHFDTLLLSFDPIFTTYRESRWETSNPLVATVDADGVVTAVGSGTATITASSKKDLNMTATSTVVVKGGAILPSSITIVGESTMEVNTQQTVTATVLPIDAEDKTVTWSSSSNTIATVNQSGLVSALITGTVTITATSVADGTIKGELEIVISAPAALVTSILLSKETLPLTVGDKETITATALPAGATDKTVTWSSSNDNIATVSQTGEIVAVATGTATITATANDGSNVFATCAVTVSDVVVAVTSVELDETILNLEVGDIQTLVATVSPDNATNKAVTWTTGNPAVASVDGTGKITALTAGFALITATADGKSATCEVNVKDLVTDVPVTSISVSAPTTVSVVRLGTSQITASALPTTATNTGLTYVSSDENIATVSATGLITAKAAGTATITIAAADGKGATAAVSVTVTPILVTGIDGVPASINVVLGTPSTISAEAVPNNADNTVLSWLSNNPGIVTVINGVLTGVAEGTTTVSVTALGGTGIAKVINVTVIDPSAVTPVTSVTVAPATLALQVGEKGNLTGSIEPTNATVQIVSWSSSNETIATVSSSGEVTAKAVGTATITGTADGKSGSATVTVSPASPVLVSSITPTPASLTFIVGGAAQSVSASVLPLNASNNAVTYSIAPAGIATVNATTGLVSPVAAGSATITISAVDASGISATVTVTVNPAQSTDVLVSDIVASPSSMELKATQTGTITATAFPSTAANRTLVYASSNTAIATVAQSGVVTAVAPGSAAIIITSADAGTAVASVVVNVKANTVPVSSIGLNVSTISLQLSGTQQLTATVQPTGATTQAVEYVSSNPLVASVSASGLVTAIGGGSAVITAKATDGSGIFTVVPVSVATTGVPLASSVTITGAPATWTIGAGVQLGASVFPGTALSQVTWISSNDEVATVSATGFVSVKKAGRATITAVAADGSGKYDKYVIDIPVPVEIVPVTSITASPDANTLAIGGITFYNVEILPSNASSKAVTVTATPAGIVSINHSRMTITGVAAGTASITVSSVSNSSVIQSFMVTVEEEPVANKKPLQDAIKDAKLLHTSNANSQSLNVKIALVNLNSAITKAEAALTSSSDAEILAAANDLNKAVNAFYKDVATVSIKESVEGASISPTPVIDIAKIKGSKGIEALKVVSVSGKVFTLPYTISGNTAELDASALAAGQYILVITYTDGSAESLNFVKK
jgi:uncharacterized protein YjdB/endo-1,4-beta-D-glucanase Y